MRHSHFIPLQEVPFHAFPNVEGTGARLNDQGYPTEEFVRTADLALLAIGDETLQPQGQISFLEVARDELQKSMGKTVQSWNLGLAGRGCDYISRTLMCGINVLQPELVIVHFGRTDRREYFRNDGKRINYSAEYKTAQVQGSPLWKKLGSVDKIVIEHLNQLQNENDDNANFLKQYKLIETMLERRRIIWGFSAVPEVEPLLRYLIERKWVRQERYLGSCFDASADSQAIGRDWAAWLSRGKSYPY